MFIIGGFHELVEPFISTAPKVFVKSLLYFMLPRTQPTKWYKQFQSLLFFPKMPFNLETHESKGT